MTQGVLSGALLLTFCCPVKWALLDSFSPLSDFRISRAIRLIWDSSVLVFPLIDAASTRQPHHCFPHQAISSCFGSDSGGLQGSEALLSVWLMWSILLGVPPAPGHSWGSSGLRERVLDGSKRIPGLPWPHLPCEFEVPFPLSLSLSSSVEARSWVEMTPEALQGPQFSFLCTGCSYMDHTGTGT